MKVAQHFILSFISNLNGEKKMLYKKMKLADKNRDINAFMELVHDDFVFVRNQNGADVDRDRKSVV